MHITQYMLMYMHIYAYICLFSGYVFPVHAGTVNDMMFSMKKRKIIRILLVCICLMFSGHIALSVLRPARISTYIYGTDRFQDADYTDISFAELNETVSDDARPKYSIPKGNGKDTVTVLFYLIGNDEPSSASATINTLNNILYAADSEKLNIVIQTGGCSSWNSKILRDDTIQRWHAENDSLKSVKEVISTQSMCDPDTLYDFIRYGLATYPSDRTFLFLSGSGSSTSFGYDPKGVHTDLSYTQIAGVLSRLDSCFDLICLDTPYASTFENALLFEPYADYLTAFETDVSTEGMLYQSFLTRLALDTSISTLSLGKLLIDSYALNHAQKGNRDPYVLSLLDLSEIRHLSQTALDEFGQEMTTILKNGTYATICDVLHSTSTPSHTEIDLTHFAHRLSLETAETLFVQLNDMIKYRRSYGTANLYGISSISPYLSSSFHFPQGYRDFLSLFDLYTDLADAYSSLVYPSISDQLVSRPMELIEPITPEILLSSQIWKNNSDRHDAYDQETLMRAAQTIIDTSISPASLQIHKRNDQYILHLSEKDQSIVQDVTVSAFLPYGSAYVSAGAIESTSITSDGMPRFPSSPEWYFYHDQPVPFTAFYQDASGNTIGHIPALLNGRKATLIARKDRFSFRMELIGADTTCRDSTVSLKGIQQLKSTDQITFLYDVYGQDGSFSGTYTCYSSITVANSLYLKNMTITQPICLCICLKDSRDITYSSQILSYPVETSR